MTATGLAKAFYGAKVSNTNMPIVGMDKNTTLGSLMLFDAAHSVLGLGGVVPAHGAAVQNVAWEMAQKLIPSGTQSTLAATFTNTFTPTEGKLEITGKGGLHVCPTQAGAIASTHQAGIFCQSLTIAYLLAKWSTNKFALAVHDDVTRKAKFNSTELWEAGIRNGSAGGMSNFLLGLNRPGPQPVSTGTAFLAGPSWPADPSANLGSRLRIIAVNGGTGVVPPAASSITAMLSGWGAVMAFSTAGALSRSSILYRAHLVDLTAAGMTADEFSAAEYAIWKEDTAAGGRYDPATETFTPANTLLA